MLCIWYDEPSHNWMYPYRFSDLCIYAYSPAGKKISRMRLEDAVRWIEKRIGRKLDQEEIQTLKRFRYKVRQKFGHFWLQDVYE